MEFTQDENDIAVSLFQFSESRAFGMQQSRPSDRCQAALDGLLEKGMITVEKHGHKGKMYKPTPELKKHDWKPIDRDSDLTITQPLQEHQNDH